MSLLRVVAGHLVAREVPFAAIGAAALARHGIARSTIDVGLLATDARTLDASFRRACVLASDSMEIRKGDLLDPLAGVVRIRNEGERPVDVVVGRHRWQDQVLARATPSRILDVEVPVVSTPDLVLLKLFAGGPQDAWDVRQLLEGDVDGSVVVAVGERLGSLPPEAAAFWRKIREG